ncbi:hypothetical protein chiPu_0017382 [Chiloscyllium punctatum]|uniref:Tetraspanin n=1 Tax=Chiloscyllium punctatum TaxID=137246 RepID=A0A401RFJ0_CHIPU|nr:hypothetical protein [Chiloscyllium punctatum]
MDHCESSLYFSDAVDSLITDPALILIIVGCLMFCITFLGCTGALRNNQILLKIFMGFLLFILLAQIIGAALGFIFSKKVETKTVALFKKGIIRYRDDLDLQNLIDFIQKKIVNTMCGYETQSKEVLLVHKIIYMKGCLENIVNWGHENLNFIGGVCLSLLLVEVAMIVLAVVLLKKIKYFKKRKAQSQTTS